MAGVLPFATEVKLPPTKSDDPLITIDDTELLN
jgi:hypothetical protein